MKFAHPDQGADDLQCVHVWVGDITDPKLARADHERNDLHHVAVGVGETMPAGTNLLPISKPATSPWALLSMTTLDRLEPEITITSGPLSAVVMCGPSTWRSPHVLRPHERRRSSTARADHASDDLQDEHVCAGLIANEAGERRVNGLAPTPKKWVSDAHTIIAN